MDYSALLREALSVRERAYAPYSGFAVGAALLAKSGAVYRGCNLENAAFSPGICAERAAFAQAVSAGEREFAAIAVVGGKAGEKASAPCYPCGVCRQVMREFCGPDFLVVTSSGDKGFQVFTLEELLPHGFGPESI